MKDLAKYRNNLKMIVALWSFEARGNDDAGGELMATLCGALATAVVSAAAAAVIYREAMKAQGL